jgi:uncharacterized membrane protein
MISIIHTACGFLALALGVVVLLNDKGTRFHRKVGWTYWLVMLVLNVTAFRIYHLTGHWNIFHIFAVLSLATLSAGLIPVLLRKQLRNWLALHYTYMAWSYAGLLAATSNELFAHVPVLKGLVRITGQWVILAALVVILGLSALLISRRKDAILISYNHTIASDPAPTADPLYPVRPAKREND